MKRRASTICSHESELLQQQVFRVRSMMFKETEYVVICLQAYTGKLFVFLVFAFMLYLCAVHCFPLVQSTEPFASWLYKIWTVLEAA